MPLFVDTGYWVGLTYRQDQHHGTSLHWANYLLRHRHQLVTTEAVLWEYMNSLSHPLLRQETARGYRACRCDPQIEVVGFDPGLIDQALETYESRHDKDWSLTDCLSFVVMQRRGLHQALTADRHFQQAGFEALLLREPTT